MAYPTSGPNGDGPSKADRDQAVKERERARARARMGRRALLLGGGAVVVAGAAGGVIAFETKLGGDFAAGVEAGAKQLAQDLQTLGTDAEKLALSVAVDVADVTEWGTEHLIAPIADLVETLGDDVLGVLYNAVSGARDALGHANFDFGALDALAGALGQMKAFLDDKTHNPNDYTLGKFLTTEVKIADSYLHALQQKLDDTLATPTPVYTLTPSSATDVPATFTATP